MSAIDLSTVPFPAVVEVIDREAILTERKAALVALTPEDDRAEVAATLETEFEPATIQLQENATREVTLRQRVNDAARALTLAYAEKSDLDQLAANSNLVRLTVTPADDTTIPPTPAVMEDDDSLRERIQLAPEGMSVAGPKMAYVKHARDADGRVADASALSPSPCVALITVLSTEGDGTASADLLAKVEAALNDEDVRPVGDRVQVQSARIVYYTIKAVLHLQPGPEAEPILAEASRRLALYQAERRRLKRSINRSAINAALFVTGLAKVDVIEPADDIEISAEEAGFCLGAEITQGAESV